MAMYLARPPRVRSAHCGLRSVNNEGVSGRVRAVNGVKSEFQQGIGIFCGVTSLCLGTTTFATPLVPKTAW